MASRSDRLHRPPGVRPLVSSASRRHGRSWPALNAAALASRLRVRAGAVRGQPDGSGFCSPSVLARRHRRRKRRSLHRPALAALEARLGDGKVAYVSVGPASNFRARRWWHRFRGSALPESVPPIEAYAPLAALAESRRVWKERHRTRRALWKSADLRAAAIIRGVRLLAGCSRGTGRHRDAAMAVVRAGDGRSRCHARRPRPAVVVTYAEAGGWGRAIVLESRRRGDSVGRPAARLHLPALAELSSRTGRDGRRIPERLTIAASRVRPSPCSSTTTSALI